MRVLLLLGALFGIVVTSRRWDQIHPLRTATGSGLSLAAGEQEEPYLDLELLDRRRRSPALRAAPRQAVHRLEGEPARKTA